MTQLNYAFTVDNADVNGNSPSAVTDVEIDGLGRLSNTIDADPIE